MAVFVRTCYLDNPIGKNLEVCTARRPTWINCHDLCYVIKLNRKLCHNLSLTVEKKIGNSHKKNEWSHFKLSLMTEVSYSLKI